MDGEDRPLPTLTTTAQVVATGPITIANSAAIPTINQPDPNLGDNSDNASIYVGGPPLNEANLSVLKYVDNALPYEASTIIFTVAVQNAGPVTATNVAVTDQLPTAVTYQSYSATAGTYSASTGIWAIPTLRSGVSATLTIRATVNAGTGGSTNFNTAAITSLDQPDLDPADDLSTAQFTPREMQMRPSPVFPSLYVGIAAGLGAFVLCYFVGRRLVAR